MRKLWINVVISYGCGIYLLACLIDKFSHYGEYASKAFETNGKHYLFYAYPVDGKAWIYAAIVMAAVAFYSYSGAGDWILRFLVPVRKPLENLPSEVDLSPGSTYVTEYLPAKLAEHNQPKLKINFWVQESPDPNAFAWGKNNIAVSTAILENCTTLQQHAVIMHEVGHLVHSDTRISMVNLWGSFVYSFVTRITSRFLNFVSGRRAAATTEEAKVRHDNSLVTIISLLVMVMVFAPLVVPIVICAVFSVINRHVFAFSSKAQEYAADKFSAEVGLSRDGLIEFLEMLSSISYKENPIIQAYFESHPSPRERINHLRGLNIDESQKLYVGGQNE